MVSLKLYPSQKPRRIRTSIPTATRKPGVFEEKSCAGEGGEPETEASFCWEL